MTLHERETIPSTPAPAKPKQPDQLPRKRLLDRLVGHRVAVTLVGGDVLRGTFLKMTRYEILINESVVLKHAVVSVTAEPEAEKVGA
jgi:sRNA-binding regulator protein Hfq